MLSRRRVTDHLAQQLVDGVPAAEVMQQFAAYLIDHRQTAQADRYVADLEAAIARRGHVIVDVTTARPIDDTVRERIISSVGGSRVSLREHIDEALIGGIIIKTPETLLDASVRTRLRALRTS